MARTMPGGAALRRTCNKSIYNCTCPGSIMQWQAGWRAGRRKLARSCYISQQPMPQRGMQILVAKTISIFHGLDHIISIMPARSIWSERQANNPCPFRASPYTASLCVPPYHVHASALKADTARPWGMRHAACGPNNAPNGGNSSRAQQMNLRVI